MVSNPKPLSLCHLLAHSVCIYLSLVEKKVMNAAERQLVRGVGGLRKLASKVEEAFRYRR